MPSKIYLKTSIRTLMPTIWLLLVLLIYAFQNLFENQHQNLDANNLALAGALPIHSRSGSHRLRLFNS